MRQALVVAQTGRLGQEGLQVILHDLVKGAVGGARSSWTTGALLGVGGQNLFDTFPDENVEANANLGIFPYPSHTSFGMNGRFIYPRITYRF